jgi:DNA-binding MarR family transcriptional regulator
LKPGGRRKVLYSLTPEGRRAMSNAQRVHQRAWGDVADYAFEK